MKGSVVDLPLLKILFKSADGIFHEAAIASVPKSIANPLATNEANVTGTLNVLVAARDCGVKNVVFASSTAIYGDSPELPKREEMIPDMLSPSTVTKLSGEYYCSVFSRLYGIECITLIYSMSSGLDWIPVHPTRELSQNLSPAPFSTTR